MNPSKPIFCPACKNEINETVCWCGGLIKSHSYGDGHNPVPLGYTCGYYTEKDEEYILKTLKEKYG